MQVCSWPTDGVVRLFSFPMVVVGIRKVGEQIGLENFYLGRGLFFVLFVVVVVFRRTASPVGLCFGLVLVFGLCFGVVFGCGCGWWLWDFR